MIVAEETKKCLFLIPGPIVYDLIKLMEKHLEGDEQEYLANLLGFGIALSNKCIHKEKSELVMQEFNTIEKVLLKIEELKKNGEK